MADIVVSEFMDEAALSPLGLEFDVLYEPDLVDRPDALHASLTDAKAIIVRNRTQVDRVLLDAAPNLKCVGRLGVGLDNIDLEACAARNVAVFPATGANDLSVAEYVVTAALMLLRRAWFATSDVASGGWPRSQLMGQEVSGKVLGLVGFGNIARRTGDLAQALGMTTLAHDPFVPPEHPIWLNTGNRTLEALIAQCDVLSMHVPLTVGTRHLIDAKAIAAMKPGAIIINAARGGVVDESAIIAALRSGHLGGASLDVFESEPVTAASGAEFSDIPNLILTPHIAGVTSDANVRVSRVTVENVLNHLKGNP